MKIRFELLSRRPAILIGGVFFVASVFRCPGVEALQKDEDSQPPSIGTGFLTYNVENLPVPIGDEERERQDLENPHRTYGALRSLARSGEELVARIKAEAEVRGSIPRRSYQTEEENVARVVGSLAVYSRGMEVHMEHFAQQPGGEAAGMPGLLKPIEFAEARAAVARARELEAMLRPGLEWLRRNRPAAEVEEGARAPFRAAARVETLRLRPRRLERGLEEDFEVVASDLELREFTDSDGLRLPYRWFEPEGLEEGERLPLVVFVHGRGEHGRDGMSQLKHSQVLVLVQPEAQRRQRAFFLAPQFGGIEEILLSRVIDGSGGVITNDEGAGFRWLRELFAALEEEYVQIDPLWRHGIGLSSGGGALCEIVAEWPWSFASVVSLSGAGRPPGRGVHVEAAVWLNWNEEERGLAEKALAYGAAMARLGVPVRQSIAVTQGGHASWEWALFQEGLAEWMYGKRLTLVPGS